VPFFKQQADVPEPDAPVVEEQADAEDSAEEEFRANDQLVQQRQWTKRNTQVALRSGQHAVELQRSQQQRENNSNSQDSSEEDDADDDNTKLDSSFSSDSPPATSFSVTKHLQMLMHQRHCLQMFAISRDLTMIKKEWNAKKGGTYALFKQALLLPTNKTLRKPAGPTEGFTRMQLEVPELSKLWIVKQSRHFPSSLGVFARRKIVHDKAAVGVNLMRQILPMQGVMLTEDAAAVAHKEFACPTAISMSQLPAEKVVKLNHGNPLKIVTPKMWTLMADPTCRAAIINSAASADIQDTEAKQWSRINCDYASVNSINYSEDQRRTIKQFTHRGAADDGREKQTFSNYAIHVRLTRDIEADEELLLNYGSTFESSEDSLPTCEECQTRYTEESVNLPLHPALEVVLPEAWRFVKCACEGCSHVIHRGCKQAGKWRCNMHQVGGSVQDGTLADDSQLDQVWTFSKFQALKLNNNVDNMEMDEESNVQGLLRLRKLQVAK